MSEVESDSPMAARFVVVLVGLAMAVATGMAIGSDDLFLGLGLVLVGGAILYLLRHP